MPQNRVAIVSKHSKIVSFLRLEAISYCCSVTVLESAPTDTSPYDRIVMDASLGYCISDEPLCRVVTLYTDGKNGHGMHVGECWEWPVRLAEIRDFFAEQTALKTVSRPRTLPYGDGQPILYVLSDKDRTVLYRNRQITLSEREWQLLVCLAKKERETVSRKELLACFSAEDGNIADVYICHLRKKLEEPFGIRLIHTVRNKGYRLSARLIRPEQLEEKENRKESKG